MSEQRDEMLLPCPFCGDNPTMSSASHHSEVTIFCDCLAYPNVVVRCSSIDNGDGRTFHYDNIKAEEEAIKAWNTRKSPTNSAVGGHVVK